MTLARPDSSCPEAIDRGHPDDALVVSHAAGSEREVPVVRSPTSVGERVRAASAGDRLSLVVGECARSLALIREPPGPHGNISRHDISVSVEE